MIGSALLAVYRTVSAFVAPFAPLWLQWRASQGREDGRRLRERLGRPAFARPGGPLAWLHGATARDALLLLPLVTRLTARDFNVILSTGPMASAAMLESRLPARARHQFVPVDVPQCVARFLDHWQPQLALVAGPEARPTLLTTTRRKQVPLLLVEARWATGAWAWWRDALGFTGALFLRAEGCLVRSEDDADRFRAAGVPNVRVVGSLAYDVLPQSADAHDVAELASRLGSRPIWVAAGVQPEEEAIVIAAHLRLKALWSSLITVIVPRRPERGPLLAKAAAEAGLAVGLHSDGVSALAAELHVVDAAGGVGLFYRLAGIVFLGSSLGDGHGRNPVEAARLGRAILHGPHVERFQDIYAALGAAKAAARVGDADTLARSVAALLSDGAKMRMMGRAAAAVIEERAGAADRTMQVIEPHLAQAMLARSQ